MGEPGEVNTAYIIPNQEAERSETHRVLADGTRSSSDDQSDLTNARRLEFAKPFNYSQLGSRPGDAMLGFALRLV